MWARVGLLLPLLSTACFGELYYVDSRFTPEEAEQIRVGAELWAPTGLHRDLVFGLQFSDVANDRNMIIRSNSRGAANIDEYFKEHTTCAAARLHSPIEPTRIIILMDKLNQDPLRVVAAHELGHSMGLDHVSDMRAIMAPKGSEESLNCLTGADVAEACRHGDSCPSTRPIGCEETP